MMGLKLQKYRLRVGLLNFLIISFYVCLINGCNSYRKSDIEAFRNLYSLKIKKKSYKSSLSNDIKKLSLSAVGMPFMAFARWLSDNSTVGIVYESKLDKLRISSEFKNATADEIINSVARRFSLDVVLVGSTYFLGELKPEDRGLLVKKVRGYSSDQLVGAISVFLSEHGKVNVYTDGTCIVSDRETILKRVSDMFDKIESALDSSWIVQLFFVSFRSGILKKSGVNVKPSGELAYTLSKINNQPATHNTTIDFDVNALFNLGFNTDLAEYRATPMFLLRDGVSGKWSDGESVPIPEKTVSDQGTVTTTGYTYVDTGLIIDLVVRDSKSGAVIKINVTESSITGFVDEAPILNKSVFKAEMVVESNQIYLIGELKRKRSSRSLTDYLAFDNEAGNSSYQIWCRVYKISGGSLESPVKKKVSCPKCGKIGICECF